MKGGGEGEEEEGSGGGQGWGQGLKIRTKKNRWDIKLQPIINEWITRIEIKQIVSSLVYTFSFILE